MGVTKAVEKQPFLVNFIDPVFGRNFFKKQIAVGAAPCGCPRGDKG